MALSLIHIYTHSQAHSAHGGQGLKKAALRIQGRIIEE